VYLTHPRKPRAATRCLAVSRAHAGNFDFQPDTTGRTQLSISYDLFQEVTMLVIPTPNQKAAVAAAASSAQMNALTGNPIVPPPRRNSPGFRSSLPTIFSLNPFWPSLLTHKTFPRLHIS
jgi:hypothetical protein